MYLHQTDRLRLEDGVRLRPVIEMGVCLAYTPTRPALHSLDPVAWLVADLCDGRSLADIAVDFAAAIADAPPRPNGTPELNETLAGLMAAGIVVAAPPADSLEIATEQGEYGGK